MYQEAIENFKDLESSTIKSCFGREERMAARTTDGKPGGSRWMIVTSVFMLNNGV
jgi:hypothetical protein